MGPHVPMHREPGWPGLVRSEQGGKQRGSCAAWASCAPEGFASLQTPNLYRQSTLHLKSTDRAHGSWSKVYVPLS